MKVLTCDKMPNGMAIQIEDWSDVYPTIYDTITIAAYPIAKNSSKYRWIESGRLFRLALWNFKSDEQVVEIYDKLKSGELNLKDLAYHFSNGKKDEWLLGMIDRMINIW